MVALAQIPPVTAQGSLLGLGAIGFDPMFSTLERIHLNHGAWVDYAPGWLEGHQHLFDTLLETVRWEQHERPMYERVVEVPRLIGSIEPDGQPGSIVDEVARALGRRYRVRLERIGVALYRDGRDSVAWHGDQVARELPQALVATVSLGEPRTFALRPKAGGEALRFRLGHGDLVVMGGTCQRTWQHSVPKVARAGPRIALMFRPVWASDEGPRSSSWPQS